MEPFLKEAEKWLRQAEYDLKAAEWTQQGGFHAQATFLAQQSAAKSLRSFLFLSKEDARETRSVVELIDRAIVHEEEFRKFVGSSRSLDLYYKTSRFPDAIPGGIPSEIISGKESVEAIRQAADIIAIVEKKRKSAIPESL
ncbi:MAG: HEPN domain-containing protein [Deltaproteobacteria bacterium]|nr:HEPN domain-containing protein [Deltaproteobacteria bacterium]MCL4872931.1 HEPN domain-containing protein [bacterium]